MKKFHLSLCALALTSFVYAKEVKIGVVLPLSGATAAYGQSALEGIKIAHLMQNTLDNGDKVELVITDDKGEKIEAANSATRLIATDEVLALIGEMTTAHFLQVVRIAQKDKIPVISPAASSAKITDKPYAARVSFSDNLQGEVLARYAITKMSFKETVIVLDQSNDFSLNLAKVFEKEFVKNGGKIKEKIRISTGDKDFKAIISKIKTINPEFIFIPIFYHEAALFARQALAMNVKIPTLSGWGIADQKFIELAGEAANGYIFSDSFDFNNPQTKLSKEFIAEFEKKNKTKEVPNFSAMGADAYFVMFEAMNKCTHDLTSECINKQIHSTSNFQGVSGIINIDQSGETKRSVVIKEVKDLKQVFKDIINP
ncbi:branched-chain amino acid ABC transporter substrate-binding protein [Campylobacter sp. MIT 99-7217]|uniref:ABC transporter substrate-binding protein n=1 Tax=Campylobacter sp. MIT 99-7217 TaxID=535091 RepID=UPI001158C905|nr:ABC transporter substrate-binding protein [Campylobacter sp. MIT 99-7217]TQR33713.1 branched-chain amino acid ABC transporter substrate-binding protein [Campylobacter sp. MIT 99-7217]